MKPLPKSIRVCSLEIPVRIGTIEDDPDLKGKFGVCDMDGPVIWLSADNAKHTQPFWAAHEALHALLLLSGVIDATISAFNLRDDDPRLEPWEETIIRILTPHIISMFGHLRPAGAS